MSNGANGPCLGNTDVDAIGVTTNTSLNRKSSRRPTPPVTSVPAGFAKSAMANWIPAATTHAAVYIPFADGLHYVVNISAWKGST